MLEEKNSLLPLYYQLKQQLKEKITAGGFGEQLPSEARLKEEYGVSVWTVRRAIAELAGEGVVKTFKGKGSFISKDKVELKRNIKAVKTIKTKNIGFIFYRSGDEFKLDEYYADIFSRIAKNTSDKGYNISFSSVFDEKGIFHDVPGIINEKRIDGAVLIGLEDSFGDQLEKRGIPFVIADYRSSKYDCVVVDNVGSGFKATEYLINNGHKKIAYVGGLKGDIYSYYKSNMWPNSLDRETGYRQALEAHGIELDKNLIKAVRGVSDIDNISDLFDKKVTAIFCFNDYTAALVIKKAASLGIKVPENLSVVGFGGSTIAGINEITSVEVDKNEISGEAVDILFRRINREYKSEHPKQTVIYTKLVERKTVNRIL